MKRSYLIYMLALFLTGCERSIPQQVFGEDSKPSSNAVQYYVLACCRDNVGGNLSYPAFVPASHIQICESARQACLNNDCKIGNDIYLPTNGDCEKPHKVGYQYYLGHGY